MKCNSETDISSRKELKERIILQALESFRVNGIKAITMDDIANSLRISKRTLYEVFADKESLLSESIIYNQRQSKEALKELVANSENVLEVILKCYQGSVEAYHSVNRRFFDDIKKYPRVNELLKASHEQDNMVVINFLKQGVEQGLFREDINFHILKVLVREQIKLLMDTDLCEEFDFLEVYESIMFIYLRGISTEKGTKKLDEFISEYRKKRISQTTN